ncbi:MAG TPA: GxxExxY protein [Gemmatimonadaceae bacterium]|nr:GxxExxY protein [Gemmatimonadaceae bacterium]
MTTTTTTHPNLANENDRVSRADSSSRLAIVERELSYLIIAAFFEVYNALGFGFLESVYARAMEVALGRRGLLVQREVPVVFDGVEVGRHRLDMLVERRIVLEIKSTERLSDVPKRQLRNYLAATNLELGIILHFGPKAEYHRVLYTKQV